MERTFATILAGCLFFSSAAHATGESRKLGFDDDWEMFGDENRIENYLGRTALRMRSGRAIRRDVRLDNGVIELDVAVTGHRSFVYVQFRMQSDRDYEEFYFRPHKSGLPDAIQYTPVYGGDGNWQLYHGEGFTAPATFPQNEWVRIRIVLEGDRAAVSVGDVSAPQLVVPRLARPSQSGYIAVRSFLPGGEPTGIYAASFSNLRIDDDVPEPIAEPERAAAPDGVVSEWLVSAPFTPEAGPIVSHPEVSGWAPVRADETGLVVIGKERRRPARGRASALAKLTLSSTNAQTVPFHLGFSDEVSVFLGGQLLVSLDQSYSFNFPRRQGLIGFEQATLYLPLVAGDNELVLAVSDSFGGWGVMGRLGAQGVIVSAR